jgi:hypothetical protein
MSNENKFAHFLMGFAAGVFFFFIILLIVSSCSALDYEYKYIDIEDLICIEVNSEIVSCDWSEFRE